MEIDSRSLNRVEGLEEFIDLIKRARTDISHEALKKVSQFIQRSGCNKISFTELGRRAAGFSKPGECLLNLIVLNFPIEYFMYIVLHEISHQYQYQKYGCDYMLDVYSSTTDLQKATDKLLFAEKVADRFALIKTHEILGQKEIIPRYLNLTDSTHIKNYISSIRIEASDRKAKSIDEINEAIFFLLKNE
jgi:hypothetical protein